MDNIKQINTGVAEIISVKVPEGITGWAIGNGCVYFNSVGVKLIPHGDYEPLGLSTELTEEQCMELVTKGWNIAFGILYKGAVRYHVTAQKAFASLMQANGINETHIILKRLS